jgi:hypothetical protein
MTTITPEAAAEQIRKGGKLDVTVDVAEKALALAVPHLFRHVDPTAPDGRTSLSKFRRLADNAGLPHDHPSFAGWLTLRALRVEAGDRVVCRTGCPVTGALLASLGADVDADDALVITTDAQGDAITITAVDPADDETGAIATPSGTIRFPNAVTRCPGGTLATALIAVERVAAESGAREYDQDPDAVVELPWERPVRAGSIDADSIHEDWVPEIATHPDLKPHPARLIQSATLSTVSPPKATYRPRLPRRVIRSGLISDAQFEFIVAAGQAHSRHLPVDPENPGNRPERVGIYLADGTGAGKTNELLGVALDNRLRGRLCTILVLEKKRHLKGFVEAWAGFGQDPSEVVCLWDLRPDQPISLRRGILVVTYNMLRDATVDAGHVRVAQIAAWAGPDFEGPMLFDEAQCMRNAAGDEDRSGKKSQVSMQGLGGVALQDALPGARVVYASATGATDVHNLGYCTRLGIWGEGTAFKTRNDFICVFEAGGIADLEQVTLSLKASGVYVARSLSFEGVEVVNLPVTLTREERNAFNQAADMWKKLKESYLYLARVCNSPLGDRDKIADFRDKGLRGAIPYSNLNGFYETSRKASMSTLIASFKARGVIADAEKRVADGHSFVIQMQNTYEAQLNRALDQIDDPTDVRLQPCELVSFAECMPVEMYEQVTIPNPDKKAAKKTPTIKVFRQKLDEKNQPVLNQHAVSMRDELIEECRGIELPLPALDQIMLHFGSANVGEITGRTRRLVSASPNGQRDGSTGIRLEDRKESDRAADMEDFHAGRKSGFIFSVDAGGSSLSYHAKAGTIAGDMLRQPYHYLIQLGHRADQVTQGIGRTHRADQTIPPVVSLVTVDLPADKLYGSRIVTSLFKLGALTQGHRQATSNGMFDERDCLDGPYAEKAWKDLQESIQAGEVPGYTWERFMQDLNLDASGSVTKMQWGQEKSVPMLTNVNSMINRVAALGDRRQNVIFDKLREKIDKRIEDAIADGTFNAGPEVMRAKSLRILADRAMATDRIHGGSTRVLRIRRMSETEKVPFASAYRRYLQDRSRQRIGWFAKHRTTGQFALIAPSKPMETALGERIAMSDVITPTGTTTRPARFVDREPWIPFSNMDERLESMWNAAVDAAPAEEVTYVTIIADALLPVWPVLAKASGGRDAVYRIATDDGTQIVGRPIATRHYPAFCAGVGESSKPAAAEVEDVIEALREGNAVAIASASRTPHMLVGEFTGSRMTGVAVLIGNGYSKELGVVFDMLPGADTKRRPGEKCVAAIRSKDVPFAVESILAVCPAVYIENASSASSKPAAGTTGATTAAPAAAPANATSQMMAAA